MTSSYSGEQEFRRFDVVSEAQDHHFLFKPLNPHPMAAQKKIMQEWKTLDKGLPESIYVRVYENRTDLLRAAIVGAHGTPYHDGLFFFDIYFPADYPTRPPLVHYWSFGYRINPNLYADGRVCLSLLNTWFGKKNERWNSQDSTILQLLLSIQALILNEKPYFNEPGSKIFPGKSYLDKKSMAYNEEVFVLNCRTMVKLITTPKENFKPLIEQHFKNRAEFILSACDGYRRGLYPVGYFYSGVNGSGKKIEVSSKFKDQLAMVYGSLVGVMTRLQPGVANYVQMMMEQREYEEREKKAKEVAKKKGKMGMNSELGKKVVKKLKEIISSVRKSKTNHVPVLQSA